jgi:ATP-dependent Lon protease
MQQDLKVIILKGFVLLPNNELKVDLNISQNILDTSEFFNDNKVLVITDFDSLEETINYDNLPKIGTIAFISQKIELPNHNYRISLNGIDRAQVKEYIIDQTSNEIDAIVKVIKEEKIDSKEENIFYNRLIKEVEEYTNSIPYISNSFLNQIKKEKSLNKITDQIAPYLNIDNERLFSYLKELNISNRVAMIIDDIKEEQELFQIEKNLDIKLKKELDENQREFFLREKIKLIKEELGDTTNFENDLDNYYSRLEQLNCNKEIKDRIRTEIKRLETIPPTSPEISVERNYIDWMLDLPWNTYTIDNDDLKMVKEKLDTTHDGLEKVKNRIIEYLAIKQLTNCLRGPILCLVGPPGVGKTSLAFSIADAMNRKFVKISVGGINDEAEIIGHRRTYIGAAPGRIIASLKKAKSSNPVFLIDEIDKMIRNFKGDPSSVLLSVLDPEQNKYFSDNYLEEEYDLSKIMFIATANYVEDIPEALRDRLEIIYLSGYTEYEKVNIAKNYLLPKICKEYGINYSCVKISDEILLKIIRNYTKESGVRELERQLSSIIRKIITSLAAAKISTNKFIVDNKKLKEYLGIEKYEFNKIKSSEIGVVNGLAYTTYGGDILPIEVSAFPGTGKLILTGSLGDVMKESALVAINYIKSNAKFFKIDNKKFLNQDIHIHAPNAAIPKEGPSAGIALTTALISLFTNKKIDKKIAFTGEITLRGNILPIGGLKEKSIGALRSGIKKIYIPFDNIKELEELPNEVKKEITFIPVKNYKDIYLEMSGLNEK